MMTPARIKLGFGAMALFMSASTTALAQESQHSASVLEEVIVTATRQATDIQRTPVQVTALSAAKLQEGAANQMKDITYLVPAVRYTSDSGAGFTSITMRGVGQSAAAGSGVGVQVYFNEVPLAGIALNPAPYDISSVEVLQGPQGTLFGRNTLGGAILTTPVLPTFEQNGYVKGGYGSFDLWTAEGAGNVVVIPDVLVFRVAGQIQRRDGFVTSLSPALPKKQGDLKTEAFRATMLFQPSDSFRNVLTYDYFHEDDTGHPTVLVTPPAGQPTTPALINCDHQCIDYGSITQKDLFFIARSHRVYNTTTYDMAPNVTVKNIIGYQDTKNTLGDNALGGVVPFFVIQAFMPASRFTEEFQIRANLFDNRLQAHGGAYYEKNWVHGKSGGIFPNFPVAPPLFGLAQTSGLRQSSYALFGNLTYAINDQLKIHGGYRYTWDEQTSCSTTGVGGPLGIGVGAGASAGTDGLCFDRAATNDLLLSKKSSSAPSWSYGVDWQATEDLFFYAVSRRGYRAAPLNQRYTNPCLLGAPSTFAGGTCTNDIGVAASFPVGTTPTPAQAAAAATGRSINLSSIAFTDAETLTDYELGMRSTWNLNNVKARLNLTYFHYKYDNVATRIPLGAPSPVVYNFLNCGTCATQTVAGSTSFTSGKIKADGVQGELALIPVDNLTLSFSGSYIDERAAPLAPPAAFANAGLSPTQLANVQRSVLPQITSVTPKWSYAISARYVLPFHPLEGDIAINYNYFWTKGWFTQNLPVPGYDLHNLRIDWTNIGGKNIDAGFWVRNLFDEEYILSGANYGAGVVNYGEPRMVGVDVSYHF
jgi:iron complex outermembrane receptor protein